MALPTHQHKHIAAWQSSGLSQVAYCRQHQLNSKTFANWLRVYRTQPVAAVASTLIPVEIKLEPVSYTHLRAHETVLDLVCRLLLEKKKNNHLQATS